MPKVAEGISSMADIFDRAIKSPDGLPGSIVEGADVRTATIRRIVTSPVLVRNFIASDLLTQPPLALTDTLAEAGAGRVFTFTPDAAASPGDWMSYVYAVLTEADFGNDHAPSPLDVTVAGFTAFGNAVSFQIVTSPPFVDRGVKKVRIWHIPAMLSNGEYVYTPLAYRPALSAGANLASALNLVVTVAAGPPTGVVYTVTGMTRGQPEVDQLANELEARKHLTLAGAARILQGR